MLYMYTVKKSGAKSGTNPWVHPVPLFWPQNQALRAPQLVDWAPAPGVHTRALPGVWDLVTNPLARSMEVGPGGAASHAPIR